MCEATEMGVALGMTLLEKVDGSRRTSEGDRAIQANIVRGNSKHRIRTQS